MRILVTKQGNTIIQEIDDLTPIIAQTNSSFNNYKKLRGNSTGFQMRTPQYNKSKLRLNKFSQTNNKFDNYYKILNKKVPNNLKLSKIKLSRNITNLNLEDVEITKDEINSAKKIKVKGKKIYFPKQFAEKYEKIDNEKLNSILINSSNNNNIFPSIASNNSLIEKEKFLSLGEIIPNNLIKQMKKKIIFDKKLRDRDTIITQNDFRSEYKPESDIQKFNNILSKSKVKSNKLSLIKYLNERKVDPLTVKLLSHRDGNKINKINKICQIIFQNEEKNKLFNDIVKNKVKQSTNNTRKDFQNTIKDMGNDMSLIKQRLKKYENSVDNKERYRELHYDMITHHWLKSNLERFNKKSSPKPEYLKTFFE